MVWSTYFNVVNCIVSETIELSSNRSRNIYFLFPGRFRSRRDPRWWRGNSGSRDPARNRTREESSHDCVGRRTTPAAAPGLIPERADHPRVSGWVYAGHADGQLRSVDFALLILWVRKYLRMILVECAAREILSLFQEVYCFTFSLCGNALAHSMRIYTIKCQDQLNGPFSLTIK